MRATRRTRITIDLKPDEAEYLLELLEIEQMHGDKGAKELADELRTALIPFQPQDVGVSDEPEHNS